MSPQLLSARPADVPAIASLWHAAWHDAHALHVPPALLPHRQLPHFHALALGQLSQLTLAWDGDQLAGFVGVDEDELERLFVAPHARGTGSADLLLAHGERMIAATFPRAYLIVLEANARARRFYARHGWIDTGPFLEHAPIAGGTIPLQSCRYEKALT